MGRVGEGDVVGEDPPSRPQLWRLSHRPLQVAASRQGREVHPGRSVGNDAETRRCIEKYEVGWGFKMAFSILKQFNPLGVMRLSGPWGPGLATSRRPDLARKFIPLLGEEDSVQVNNYLYHCNAHRAEGESAFRRLSRDFFWAKSPFLAE